MFLLLLTVILVLTGLGQSHYPKMLTCPLKANQRSMPRVWCKQSNDLCCSGFAFPEGTTTLENGDLRVQQDMEAFTVTVTQLAQGEGVYWCGLLYNNTIIKVAEQYFGKPSNGWSIVRWILMPVLPLMVIFTHIYTCRKARKQEEGLNDNISMAAFQGHRTGE
ncbi:uncharacterized protein si:ch211-102c2.4 isoform X1 [Anguilla rostrata]|uniref:uncharacterized protein si:ch211-102c2.4 isoform X1 n=1 Tax=Anguilla rostrata TaxID=7938 RepID=UPI0030D60962